MLRFITISAELPDYPEHHLDASAGVLLAPTPPTETLSETVSLADEPDCGTHALHCCVLGDGFCCSWLLGFCRCDIAVVDVAIPGRPASKERNRTRDTPKCASNPPCQLVQSSTRILWPDSSHPTPGKVLPHDCTPSYPIDCCLFRASVRTIVQHAHLLSFPQNPDTFPEPSGMYPSAVGPAGPAASAPAPTDSRREENEHHPPRRNRSPRRQQR